MDLALLERTLAGLGEPEYRAGQVWEWAARGATSYGEMTNLPGGLRERLTREVPLSSLTCEREARSRDGTEKALLRTSDGRPLEAVLMRYGDGRRSLCLSSQSGCPLTCAFCATGAMRFGRNLTASEILDQALHFLRRHTIAAAAPPDQPVPRLTPPRPTTNAAPSAPDQPVPRLTPPRPTSITNAVFMGMGEPLINLDAVLGACERLPAVGIASSHTTVSTVGWIPGIERMAREGPPVRLALSVHAADEELRSELMPVNDRYPLTEVLEACRAWSAARRRKVFVEYLMLEGVNDDRRQAARLAEALAPRGTFKVNLIPYNPTGAGFGGSGREAIDAFRATLVARGVPVTVRLTRGRDIDAACGQLAAKAQAIPWPARC